MSWLKDIAAKIISSKKQQSSPHELFVSRMAVFIFCIDHGSRCSQYVKDHLAHKLSAQAILMKSSYIFLFHSQQYKFTADAQKYKRMDNIFLNPKSKQEERNQYLRSIPELPPVHAPKTPFSQLLVIIEAVGGRMQLLEREHPPTSLLLLPPLSCPAANQKSPSSAILHKQNKKQNKRRVFKKLSCIPVHKLPTTQEIHPQNHQREREREREREAKL